MSVFHNAARTAFRVAKKLGVLYKATFKSIVDNGIDDPVTTEIPVEVIREKFEERDIRGLIFRDKIQPSDIKLLVLGAKISEIDTNDVFNINGIDYTVFGCELDPAGAVWTVGVR